MGLITKGEPFSIIWREPALASYLLSNSPSVAQDLSCYLSCSFSARESAEIDHVIACERLGSSIAAFGRSHQTFLCLGA